MKTVMFFSILYFCQIPAFAQRQPDKSSNCPRFSIEPPNDHPKLNEKFSFKVIIDKGFVSSKLRFKWIISNGKILSGQGTKFVTVKKLDDSSEITASVEIQDLPKDCHNTAIVNSNGDAPLQAKKVDEFEKISDNT